jgi:hypothetical protein
MIKQLASLKLAVVIILGLAAVTSWGTFVEAEYNAEIAGKTVYHSPWMYSILGFLCVSLIAVMADRWPWQKKHIGFIFAHIGIITLLFGSLITRYWGIDGSMVFRIGETNKFVVISKPELTVYSSLDGQSYTRLYWSGRDFFLNPPKAGAEIPVGGAKLELLEYLPFALRDQKIVASSSETDGPAIRFQLQNANVNMTEWLLQPGRDREVVKNLGPAQIVLTRGEYNARGRNVVVLRPRTDGESMEYRVHSARDPAQAGGAKESRTGVVRAGDVIETGWMGMVLRVLKYMPRAKEEIRFVKEDRPTELTSAALKVRFNGQEQWIGMDSVVKFFSDNAVYIVSYANQRIDLAKLFEDPGFNMTLKKFEVGTYEGSNQPATYESLVTVPGRGDILVSMNEPLQHNGFTFYQASFNSDDSGRPVASILSVNRDPGRWIKYLGSLLIVLGAIHLFYFKRKTAAKKAVQKAAA